MKESQHESPGSINPEMFGDTPVFRGTQVPIASFFSYLKVYSLRGFLEQYPTVLRDDAMEVLNNAQQDLLDKKQELNANLKFVRWQKYLRDQLTFSYNLILTLTTSSIGFLTYLIMDGLLFNVLILLSLISLSASFVVGVWITINRLNDTRLTLQIVNPGDKEPKDVLRKKTKQLGKTTWNLLTFQAVFFGVGIFLIAFAILLLYLPC